MELVVTNERGTSTVLLEDVLFFEAFGDDCFCVTKENKYKVRLKLYDTEDFAPQGFVRIHKSYVINVFKIITLTPQVNSKLKIRMKNQEVLFCNRSYMKHFKQYLKKGEYNNE
jgi:DNA-binding LytR/AlgR family response regulator